MASFLTSLHFWTVRPLAGDSGQLLSVNSYHDKGTDVDELATELRRQWAEGRGITWTPRNKRPEKLRDLIKDSEELLLNHPVIHVHWRSPTTCQVILQSGVVLHYALTSHCGDIDRLIIDRTMVGRIGGQSETLFDGAIASNGSLVVLSFMEKPRIALVYLSQRRPTPSAGLTMERLEKLSAHGDIRVNYIDLPPSSGKRIERHLSLNKVGDLLVVWWPISAEEAWPWASLAKEKRVNASNLFLFNLSSKVELTWNTRTDASPVDIKFSTRETYHLLTVEGGVPVGDSSSCTVEMCVYEFSSSHKVEKVLSRKVELPGALLAHAQNHDESRLACACSNGQLVLHDSQRPKVLSRSLIMQYPSIIKWHPSDAILIVASSKGDIQIFDLALSLVFIQLHSEVSYQQEMLDTAAFLQGAPRLTMCNWATPFSDTTSSVTMDTVTGPSSHQNLLLVFERGPLCTVCIQLGVISRGLLGPLQLMSEYITHHQVPAAVALLQHMDWNRQAKMAFVAITMVVDHLLRLPLSADSEAFVEEALGSFLAPARPLVQSIQMQYRNRINNLVRRFFHQLVRYRKFEKAFLLAEDIGARDLFMDLHFLAVDGGEKSLAELAKFRAENINADETDNASLESLETADVDSMSSSARSNVNDDGEGTVPACAERMGGGDGLQMELSLSGSGSEDEADLAEYGHQEDDDMLYDRAGGDDAAGDALDLAVTDRLAESELTLRAASTSSASNVRDDRLAHMPTAATSSNSLRQQQTLAPPQISLHSSSGGSGELDGSRYRAPGSGELDGSRYRAPGSLRSSSPLHLSDGGYSPKLPSAQGSPHMSPSASALHHHSRSTSPR